MQHPRLNDSHPILNRAHLRRLFIFSVIGFVAVEALTIPFDYGNYREVFRRRGLNGFLCLPSVLVFQTGFLVSGVAFFAAALWRNPHRGLEIMAWLLAVAAAIYSLSLWVMQGASRLGEFGHGAAGVAGLFGFLPSATVLLIGLPLTILYGLRKGAV